MKKTLVLITMILILPNMVNARAVERIIPGDTKIEKENYIREKVIDANNFREQIETFNLEREQIQNQTREQIKEATEEMRDLKLRIRTTLSGVKDLTREEKEELKDTILIMKEEIRDIQIANLRLRFINKETYKSIKDRVLRLSPVPLVNDEQKRIINDVLNDLKGL